MKKSVLIVEPRSAAANVFSFFSYLPLLGPLYLGTNLKNNGFDVRFVSENTMKHDLTETDLNVDFLLLSCLTPTVTRGYQLAERYKSLNPHGKVIIGGPHVTFMKEEAAKYVDHVVLGEGDNVIVDLLKYGSDEKYIQGEAVKDVDTLPFIDWSIFEGHEKGNIMPIMTSRGCPFNCNFCSVAEMFGRKFRAMSPERVLEEVRRNKKRFVFFYDDNFTANKKRAHDIMDGLIKMNVKPKTWTAQVRSDVVKDPELVDKMTRSGCDRVYIGFESINPNTLKTLKKSQTPEDIKNAVNILHANNIKVHGMFMYGSDSDDPSVVQETVKFVHSSKIDTVQYMVLTPLPGTELFKRLEAENRLIHRNWEYYDATHVVFWPEKFSPIDLQQLAMDSFEKFYSFANAANEVVHFFGENLTMGFKKLAHKGRTQTYSLRNAVLKAGGKFIVKKWHKINDSYMVYLSQISGAQAKR